MFALTALAYFEEIIKKSRFIVLAAPVHNVDEALLFIEKHQATDATHNCWAYKIGQEYRFNDDGEPSETAGRPILQAIEGQDLSNVVVLVTRYFGGIKLGTGGLVRAYGGSAAKCLRQAPKQLVIACTRVRCTCSFALMERVKAYIMREGVVLEEESFNEFGACWIFAIPNHLLLDLQRLYTNLTRGQGEWLVMSS